MGVFECSVPLASGLDRGVVDTAYFTDSYSAPLARSHASLPALFFALFGHHPAWVKYVLITRNRLASLCGLEVPTASEIMNAEIKDNYNVGDKIGPWPIFSLSENELIAGRDNSHLDFRLSILRTIENGGQRVIISTICSVHNVFGKVYLFFIVPFHKWGVRRLIAAAIKSGRL
jgi:Protein of unknown function (DUF2867)